MNTDDRVIVWFSCGAASAVAAKLAVRKYPGARIVYCDLLASEHRDNLRFLGEVGRWIDRPIEIIRSKKFSDVEEVWEKKQYMSGVLGAPCTREMKKVPRMDFQLPGDVHIFGLTADEGDRIVDFEQANGDLRFEWILLDENFTKENCFGILKYEGIALPIRYSQGYRNNNCVGCVKSTSPTYWDRERRLYPEVFRRRCEQSRRIGCKLVQYHGKRIFLDELPDPITDKRKEEDIECGVICIQEADQGQTEMFG